MPRHYVLLDASVAAAHYAPKSTTSANLKDRATKLLTGSASGIEVQFLIPNFCIAEVFAVFEKYRWGRTWNKHVKTGNTLTKKEFTTARKQFADAIHNAKKILQIDLNRYHILCIDLVSPINNAYRIKRDRSSKKNVYPASTYDMQIVSMGIWLQHMLGHADFTIVTGDERLAAVVRRAKSVKLGKGIKIHLTGVASKLSLAYSPNLYPTVLNLTQASKADMEEEFQSLLSGMLPSARRSATLKLCR